MGVYMVDWGIRHFVKIQRCGSVMIELFLVMAVSNMLHNSFFFFFFFQAEDGIRDLVRSRGLGDVYKRPDHKRLCWS